MKVKETIIDLLTSTKREGIDELLSFMDLAGFYTDDDGRLAEHSLNVYQTMMELSKVLDKTAELPEDSIIICSLLHDVGTLGTSCDMEELRSLIIISRYISLSEDEEKAILRYRPSILPGGRLDCKLLTLLRMAHEWVCQSKQIA